MLVRGLISAPRGVPVGTLANRLGNVWMEKSEEKCGRKNLEEKRSVEGNYRREMWKVGSEQIFGVGDQKRNSEERSGREIQKRNLEAKLGKTFRKANMEEKFEREIRKSSAQGSGYRGERCRLQDRKQTVARGASRPRGTACGKRTCGARGAHWPVEGDA